MIMSTKLSSYFIMNGYLDGTADHTIHTCTATCALQKSLYTVNNAL